MKSRCLLVTLLALAACGGSEAPAAVRTVYVAPGGQGTHCSAKDPCGSIEAGYRAARPGDRVAVAAGHYGAQVIPSLGRRRPAIDIRGRRGVVVDGLDVRADNVAVRRISSTSYVDIDSGVPGDFVDNARLYDVDGTTHALVGTRNFLWRGGSLGPSHDNKIAFIAGTPTSYHATYDGVTWHDATRSNNGVHTECLIVLGIQGLTIRNSRFTNCAVFDVLISKIGEDPVPRDIVIENTVLEASKDVGGKDGYYSLMTGSDTLHGFELRNNVWDLGLALQGPLVDARIAGNIGRFASCSDTARYAHNVFEDKRCGASDKIAHGAFSQFVDPAGGNWRLKRGAAAIGAGDPHDHPHRDAAGAKRVGKPDAGAYEYRGRT